MIETALGRARLEREQLGCLAIGLGPGSYNGIRTSIALAQGWQLAFGPGLKVLGISSAECLAERARAEGISGRVEVVIDAQRNEFYLARYDLAPAHCREVGPLRLVSQDEVSKRLADGAVLVGPEVKQLFTPSRPVFPTAATLAQLASARTDFVPAEGLIPIYLRETAFVKAPPPRRFLD
jgi:tRNA threonylcarbamoyl adenosine modification protein YeaZ